MKSFPEFNSENFGGFASFKFIQQYNLQNIGTPNAGIVDRHVTLKTGATWMDGIGVNFNLDEKQEDTAAGKLYSYNFSGVYPGNNADISELFDELSRVNLALDCQDNLGNRRLLGNTIIPVTFSYIYKSKDTPSGRPEYSFTFTFITSQKAPFYKPV